MKITIDIDPAVLKGMMKEDVPKRRRRKIVEQAKKDNKVGEDYRTDSKVWNAGHEPDSWIKENTDFWI